MAGMRRGYEWAWAGLWSTLFAALFVSIRRSEYCAQVLYPDSRFWFVGVAVWVPLFLFFALPNRGRLFLISALYIVYLAVGHADSVPAAGVEARAIRELREMTGAVVAAGKQHPQTGFPDELPQKPSKYLRGRYTLAYRPSRSQPGGPADRFVIELTSPWRNCGLIRSFTATEDGKIHFTLQDRPATRADELLE